MNSLLTNKTALVTGASRGIGKAMALKLADEGAAVVINYIKSKNEADLLAASINEKGGRAIAIQADVSKPGEIKRLFDETEQAFGNIDIVIANAADAIVKPLADCSEEDYDRIFNTNTKGVFFILQEAVKRIRDNGRIIVTSTGGTKMFFSETSLYLGSKGAVEQFVRVLSRELGNRKITVNALSPGFTDTDLLPERDRQVATDMSPLKRIGDPEDVAEVALFLASHAGRWITGQNIGAGGGVF